MKEETAFFHFQLAAGKHLGVFDSSLSQDTWNCVWPINKQWMNAVLGLSTDEKE